VGTLLRWSYSSDDDERIVLTTPQAGIYRLRVTFNEGGGDDDVAGNAYALSLALGAACTDGLEDNDAQDAAAPIVTGTRYTGLLACPVDSDWYRFDAATNRRLTVEADFLHAEGDVDLQLYDAAGRLVAWSYSNDDDELVSYLTTAPGPYYVHVYVDYDGRATGAPYALTVTDGAP